MRTVLVMLAMLVVSVPAAADDKALKPYHGKLVIPLDAPPTSLDELPAFLKINVTKDGHYDAIKGPPWPLHLVAVLAKDPGKKPVTLVFADKADKKLAPIHAIDVTSKRRVVIARADATLAAGFAADKTYVVRLMLGKTVLAKAELTLRD